MIKANVSTMPEGYVVIATIYDANGNRELMPTRCFGDYKSAAMEQDMYRIERCRELGIKPYVMPYRDFENKTHPSQYARDLAQYVNKPMIFKTCKFEDFSPRRGFKCKEYFIPKPDKQ